MPQSSLNLRNNYSENAESLTGLSFEHSVYFTRKINVLILIVRANDNYFRKHLERKDCMIGGDVNKCSQTFTYKLDLLRIISVV